MVFCHFRYFHFCNTDISFVKTMNFPSSTTLQIFMICKPFRYICCLLFLNWGNMKYFISLIFRIGANGYCSIANWGYIYYQVSKNGSLKMLLCLFGIFILATLTLICWKLYEKTFLRTKAFFKIIFWSYSKILPCHNI